MKPLARKPALTGPDILGEPSRRTFLKITGTGVSIAVLTPATLLTIGCGPSASAAINVIVATLEETQPILKDLLPASVDLIAKAITVAKQLRDALKNGGDALTLLQQFIAPDGLFNKILDSIGLVQDPTKRKYLMGAFALVGIALRLIKGKLESDKSGTLMDMGDGGLLEDTARSLRF